MNNEQKFRKLLKHAWNNSRFYRKLYSNAGIKESDLDNIPLDDLPVVKKLDIMGNFDEVVTDDRLKLEEMKVFVTDDKNPQNVYLGEFLPVASSAGSKIASYIPYKLQEWRYFAAEAASSLLPDIRHRETPVRSAFYFGGQGHWVSATNTSLASRSYHDVLRLYVGEPVEQVWAKFNAFNPQRISTYGSFINMMVDWTMEGKLNIAPETVLVSGDSLIPYYREKIKELWGSEIYDLYATVEAIFTAIRKPGIEHYEVFTDLVLLEVVDEHHQGVQPGERGRVLVTNLVQKTLPLIRFDLYDYATLGTSNFGAETLLSLDGKSYDTLPVRLTAGDVTRIPAYELMELKIPGLKRLQFITHDPDHIEVRYLSDQQIDREVESTVKTFLTSRNAAVKRMDVLKVDLLHSGRGTKFYNIMNTVGRYVEIKSVSNDSFPDQTKPQILKKQDPEPLISPDTIPVHQAFTFISANRGAKVAVEGNTQAYTYAQLETLSGDIANSLLETGFDRTRPIAVLCQHHPMMLPSILGILKAGGFFLPLNPNLPSLRIKKILEDTQPQIMVTDQDRVSVVDEQWLPTMQAYTVDQLLHGDKKPHIHPEVKIDDPACLIYTSGSTGVPQGFVFSHKTIWVRANRYIQDYQVGPDEKLSLLQSYAVSAGIREIFGALLSGATLSMYDMAEGGIQQLPGWIQESGITHLYLVPTVWRLLLETAAEQHFNGLRSIRLGGEPVLLSDFEGFMDLKLDSCRFTNAYAATETGTICQIFMDQSTKISSGSIPAGLPVKGVNVQILQKNERKEVLTLGEVSVHGDSMALGSWDPENKQILDFKDNAYPTGDLGFQLPGGRIYLNRRKDRQVKVHGYRVDLAEIESTATALEGVVNTAAIVDQNTNEETSITLFYVIEPGAEVQPADIQQALRSQLPNQAVPNRFQQISNIPKLPGGKVNPYTLASQVTDLPADELGEVEYQNETEKLLAQIWKDVLHIDRVERDANFITLGADSIMVYRTQILIEEQFNIQLSIQEFFNLTQFDAMAEWINRAGLTSASNGQSVEPNFSLLVALRREGSKPPLFCVPPAASTAMSFENLAHHLGVNQPIYALEYPGMDGKSEPLTSIPDIGQRFIEEIQKVQPHGPYFMAGMCFGGTVAFEIAQQLLKSGESVAFLGILDSNFAPRKRKPLAYYRLSIMKFFSDKILGQQIPIVDLYPRINPKLRQKKKQRTQKLYRVFTANLFAQLTYTSKPYPELITKFSTDWIVARRATLNWQKATLLGLEDHIVPGVHVRRTPEDTTMLQEPNVQVVAEKLRECLERATLK